MKRKELKIKTGAREMTWSAECPRSKHKDQCHLQHPEALALSPGAGGEDETIPEVHPSSPHV